METIYIISLFITVVLLFAVLILIIDIKSIKIKYKILIEEIDCIKKTHSIEVFDFKYPAKYKITEIINGWTIIGCEIEYLEFARNKRHYTLCKNGEYLYFVNENEVEKITK